MKYSIVKSLKPGVVLVVALLLGTTPMLFAGVASNGHKPTAHAAGQVVYTCSMHPDVVSLKPGKCPKCGMPLTKKIVAAVYTCKMHPSVLSLKPGKCPKCGMSLTKKK